MIWDLLDSKRSKTMTPMKESSNDIYYSQYIIAEMGELPVGLQDFIHEVTEHIKEKYDRSIQNVSIPKSSEYSKILSKDRLDKNRFIKSNSLNEFSRSKFLDCNKDFQLHEKYNDEYIDLFEIYEASVYEEMCQYANIHGSLKTRYNYFTEFFGASLLEGHHDFYISDNFHKLKDCNKLIRKLRYIQENGSLSRGFSYFEENFLNIIKFQESMKQLNVTLRQSRNDEYIDEASHGKLKFDYRLGWAADTGHQIKVVYSLDNINNTDVGDFYYNYDDRKVGATHDSHLDYTRKNISKKGNTNHQSMGQKILAITDMVTKKNLQQVDLLNPFCQNINTHALSQNPENLKRANDYANSHPDCKIHLIVGQIDDSKSFKSTVWAKGSTTDKNGEDFRFQQMASSEELKDGRGWKVHNIIPKRFNLFDQNDGGFVFKQNPTKEEARQELKIRATDCIRRINMLRSLEDFNVNPNVQKAYQQEMNNYSILTKDYNDIIERPGYNVDIMKKYREGVENSGLTGLQAINYGAYMDARPSLNINEINQMELTGLLSDIPMVYEGSVYLGTFDEDDPILEDIEEYAEYIESTYPTKYLMAERTEQGIDLFIGFDNEYAHKLYNYLEYV